MTEPTYHFVKGQGWVIGPDFETAEFTLRDGRRARLEARPPQPGERYTAAWGRMWLRAPGVLKSLSDFVHADLQHYSVANEDTVDYYNEFGVKEGTVTGWATVVILDP